jgi:CRP-like cAMP-binding protein
VPIFSAELPVFDGGNYPASATALEPAQLLFISRKDYRAVCLEHPEVALKVRQVVGARLRRVVGIVERVWRMHHSDSIRHSNRK